MSNFLIDEDTDLLAAEFVLGTLDSEERASAQAMLRTDHGFIAMVRIWERRFGELHLMVEPVEPDAKILQRIKAKIAEIAPREPAPDGKPPAEATPSPELPEATSPSANAETPPPVDVAVAGTPEPQVEPQDVPANETTPKPAEIAATGESGKPAETAPASTAVLPTSVVPTTDVPTVEVSAAAEVQPSPAARPPESVTRSERGPIAKVAIPAAPPLPPPPLKLPDKLPDKFTDQRSEITIDVIHSRSRWRVFGVCMTLLVTGLVALLAAWKFVPDRLPAGLRPAQLMMSMGIEALPKAPPAVKPAPPVSGFDE